jgi:hypothetical protein
VEKDNCTKSIEIWSITSEQPAPYTDDYWAPTIPNLDNIYTEIENVIKNVECLTK